MDALAEPRHHPRLRQADGVVGRPTVVGMLTISQEIYDAVVAHARKEHPNEACGIVAGPLGSDRAQRFVPMTNAACSPTFYSFDVDEQLQAWQEMDERREEPVVVYHSHTSTEAYPSRSDIEYAHLDTSHFVLVSTRDTDGLGEFQFRSFRIVDGKVTEEPVKVV